MIAVLIRHGSVSRRRARYAVPVPEPPDGADLPLRDEFLAVFRVEDATGASGPAAVEGAGKLESQLLQSALHHFELAPDAAKLYERCRLETS